MCEGVCGEGSVWCGLGGWGWGEVQGEGGLWWGCGGRQMGLQLVGGVWGCGLGLGTRPPGARWGFGGGALEKELTGDICWMGVVFSAPYTRLTRPASLGVLFAVLAGLLVTAGDMLCNTRNRLQLTIDYFRSGL